MTFQTVTIDQICVSPLNPRRNDEDVNDTAWLEESILAGGLIYPLLVHSMHGYEPSWPDDSNAKWGAFEGGRRCRAIHRLVQRGQLPADWPVIISVRDDIAGAELIELSLVAALTPRGLHDWEVDASIVQAAEQGHSVDDIVRQTGQTERWVRQRLRLGRLVPEIFDAYAAGELSIGEAEAYAATEDHDLQLAAWDHFRDDPHFSNTPNLIRAFLKFSDREESRLLAFVGENIYRAADGGYELDLFADGPDRGRVTDPALLRGLADNKMGLIRQVIRRRSSRSDLTFALESPKAASGSTDWSLSLGIDAFDDDKPIELPDGEVAAVIDVEDDGTWAAHFWRPSKAAKRRAETPDELLDQDEEISDRSAGSQIYGHTITSGEALGADQESYARVARAAAKDEHGFTADGLQVARSMRRTLLRALIVSDASNGGTLGRDYVTWSQLRQELSGTRWQQTGTRGLTGEGAWGGEDAEPTQKLAPHLADMPAQTLWLQALERIAQEPFITIEDPAEAFEGYVDALEPVKNLAAAVLAGLALVRSANVPGWRVAAHDRLAGMACGIDSTLREGWDPTEEFIGLLPKLKRLELAEPIVGRQQTTEWSKLKDGEITKAVAAVLRDADCWIHPALSFNARLDDTLVIDGTAPAGAVEAIDG